MGYHSELMIEMQENEQGVRLAKILGLDYQDFRNLEYEIETDESKDGFIYNYRIVFDENCPKEILDKIARLKDDTVYLDPWELDEEYDYEEQYEAIKEEKGWVKKFHEELENLSALNVYSMQDIALQKILNRQIFIGIIGSMEAVLSEIFINTTLNNQEYFKNFVETHPEFKKRKFELREIFVEHSRLKDTARNVMLDTIYHNLPSVNLMFIDTFKINFPEIKTIYEAVLIRHDLVHRNGKTKDGKDVTLDKKVINDLIINVKEFVDAIGDKLKLSK